MSYSRIDMIIFEMEGCQGLNLCFVAQRLGMGIPPADKLGAIVVEGWAPILGLETEGATKCES